MLTLKQLAFLASAPGRELLAADLPDDPLAAQTALRKRCNPTEAAAVAEMRRLRGRAEASGRFTPAFARGMLGTDVLLQQASSYRLSGYVGQQLADLAGGREVLDMCCGLGMDAIGAALGGANGRGIDIDDRAVFCATHNARLAGAERRCSFDTADVTAIDLPGDAVVHVDPDRRATGRRTVLIEDYAPPARFLRGLITRTRAGTMKLSPALDRSALADWPDVETEYVSEGRVCRQLVLRWGRGRAGRRATVVWGSMADPKAESIEADPSAVAKVAEPAEWLIEPDPAVIAAGAVDALAARYSLHRIGAALAWLFGDGPVESPLVRSYHVLARTAGRESNIKRALRSLGAARVTVKPRGLKLNTDKLQRRFSSRKGTRDLVVLWCRLARREEAYIAEPAGSDAGERNGR